MSMDLVIVAVIVLAALAYMVYTSVRKFRRLSSPNVGPCGRCCDNCPFAVNCTKGKADAKPKKRKGGSCCCG